jgi:hypothetical protein
MSYGILDQDMYESAAESSETSRPGCSNMHEGWEAGSRCAAPKHQARERVNGCQHDDYDGDWQTMRILGYIVPNMSKIGG